MTAKLNLLDLLSAFAVSEGYFVQGTPPNRNNNPGDLDFAGQFGAIKKGRFAAFDKKERGIVAGLRQLCADAQRGLTLREIVHSWAPSADGNNEALYLSEGIRRVKTVSGVDIDPDVPLWDYLPISYIA